MVASDARELGRAAVAAHRWREASDRFSEARALDAAGLSGPDLELLATALFFRGRPDSSSEALISAHDLYLAGDDRVGAARTAGWLAIEKLEATDVTAAAGWVARGLRLIEHLDQASSVSGLVALVPAALTGTFVGDLVDGTRRFDEIAAIAERFGDRELAAYAAFGRGVSLTGAGRSAEGFVELDRAIAAVAAGDVSPVFVCVFYRMILDLAHQGFDLRRAEAWTSEFARWCDDQPELIAYSGQSHAYRAQLLLFHGEWAEASAAAHLAEERLRAGDFTAVYVANYQLAELYRLRGESRAADEHYRRAGETGWDPQPGLALLHLDTGDHTGAQSMIRHSVAAADEARRRRLLPAVVSIEITAGDVAAARRAADDLTTLARSAPTPMLEAVSAFAESQVLLAEGDATAAAQSAAVARSAWSGLRAPLEVARCRALAGRILRALDELDAAEVEFAAARAAFLELGALPALAELTQLTGERQTMTLTAREVEVLRLVSTGLTNRQVAGRLSLSEKTVARHLSNIFGKLTLSSRAAATAYAYEHGLI
jgi:DNA-binding CsgD family transcriptional regulator